MLFSFFAGFDEKNFTNVGHGKQAKYPCNQHIALLALATFSFVLLDLVK